MKGGARPCSHTEDPREAPRRQGAGWAGPLSVSQQQSLSSWEGVKAPLAHGPLVLGLSWTWHGQVKDLRDSRAGASARERQIHQEPTGRWTENEDGVGGGRSRAMGGGGLSWWPRENPGLPVLCGLAGRVAARADGETQWQGRCSHVETGLWGPCPGATRAVDTQGAEQPGLDTG